MRVGSRITFTPAPSIRSSTYSGQAFPRQGRGSFDTVPHFVQHLLRMQGEKSGYCFAMLAMTGGMGRTGSVGLATFVRVEAIEERYPVAVIDVLRRGQAPVRAHKIVPYVTDEVQFYRCGRFGANWVHRAIPYLLHTV